LKEDMGKTVHIANAAGFWGDDPDAPARLLRQAQDVHYLTLDYLAEVSMSILARQMQKDPATGYAGDFLHVMRALAPLFQSGRKFRVITNAGGLNPRACAAACASILREANCHGLRIAAIDGDDVLPLIRNRIAARDDTSLKHLESGKPIANITERLVTANAYMGAAPIVEALKQNADMVITGRVADPSLTVGPAIAEFDWEPDDYSKIAGATVAGHLIECGTQGTGGISTDWLSIPDASNIGFPIVEISPDGSCVITKPPITGGRVSVETVKEQLVYELGDPNQYLSPDATASFLTLKITQVGPDRVRVSGATGSAPPSTLKVSATYRAGYRAVGMLTVVGPNAVEKARRCGEMILQQLTRLDCAPQRSRVECLGAGDATPMVSDTQPPEVVLRIAVADERKYVLEKFRNLIAPLITAGPQGTTGYADIARPQIHEVFGYWPALVPRQDVTPRIEILET
jgi:hypothetical protein